MAHRTTLFILALSIFLSTHSNVDAQSTAITWGTAMKNETEEATLFTNSTASMKYDILGRKENEIYVLATKVSVLYRSNEYFFEKYSKDKLELLLRKPLLLNDPTMKDVQMAHVGFVNGKVIAFISGTIKKTKNKVLFAKEIAADGAFGAASYTLDELGNEKAHKEDEFMVALSSDNQKILTYRMGNSQDDKPKEFIVKVYDPSFKELSKSSYIFSHQNEYTSIVKGWVGKSGNAHILIKTNKGDPKKFLEYRLISYFLDTKKGAEHLLGAPGKYIGGINGTLDSLDNLIFGGFYSDVAKTGSADGDKLTGAFYTRVDRTSKEIVKNEFNPLSSATIKQLNFGKLNAPIFQFNQLNLYLENNGNLFVFADQGYAFAPKSLSYATVFDNNILLVKFNKEGKMILEKPIEKAQKSVNNSTYSGYGYFYCNQKISFLFMDHPSNVNAFSKKIEMMDDLKKANLVYVSIEAQGELKKEVVKSFSLGELFYRPNKEKPEFQLGPNELLLYTEKGNQYKFGKLVLKQ